MQYFFASYFELFRFVLERRAQNSVGFNAYFTVKVMSLSKVVFFSCKEGLLLSNDVVSQ